MTKERIQAFLDAVLAIRDAVSDEQALAVSALYPEWKIGVEYTAGKRVLYGGLLYKVRQGHTSQAEYTPDKTPALFAVINETNAGTIEDPIPAVAGMEYKKDLYYIYNDVVYLCIREDADEGTVLHFTPDALVGQYFEVVE